MSTLVLSPGDHKNIEKTVGKLIRYLFALGKKAKAASIFYFDNNGDLIRIYYCGEARKHLTEIFAGKMEKRKRREIPDSDFLLESIDHTSLLVEYIKEMIDSRLAVLLWRGLYYEVVSDKKYIAVNRKKVRKK